MRTKKPMGKTRTLSQLWCCVLSHIYHLRKPSPALFDSFEELCHALQTKSFGLRQFLLRASLPMRLEMLVFTSKPRALANFYEGEKNPNLNCVIAHLRNWGSHTKAAVLGLLGVEEGGTRTTHANTWKVHSSAAVSPRSAMAFLTQMSLGCREAACSSITQVSLAGAIRQPASIPGADRAHLFRHRRRCLKNQHPCFSLKLLHSVMSGS